MPCCIFAPTTTSINSITRGKPLHTNAMNISFTLDQMKQFNRLSAEERSCVIASCDTLSQMNDDEIDNYRPAQQQPALITEVHARLKRRVETKRRRAQHKTTAKPKPAETPQTADTDISIRIDEPTARTAAWVRTNFKRFVERVLDVIGMYGDGDMAKNLNNTWQMITSLIQETITPLFNLAEDFMRRPAAKRRTPLLLNIPPDIYAQLRS